MAAALPGPAARRAARGRRGRAGDRRRRAGDDRAGVRGRGPAPRAAPAGRADPAGRARLAGEGRRGAPRGLGQLGQQRTAAGPRRHAGAPARRAAGLDRRRGGRRDARARAPLHRRQRGHGHRPARRHAAGRRALLDAAHAGPVRRPRRGGERLGRGRLRGHDGPARRPHLRQPAARRRLLPVAGARGRVPAADARRAARHRRGDRRDRHLPRRPVLAVRAARAPACRGHGGPSRPVRTPTPRARRPRPPCRARSNGGHHPRRCARPGRRRRLRGLRQRRGDPVVGDRRGDRLLLGRGRGHCPRPASLERSPRRAIRVDGSVADRDLLRPARPLRGEPRHHHRPHRAAPRSCDGDDPHAGSEPRSPGSTDEPAGPTHVLRWKVYLPVGSWVML